MNPRRIAGNRLDLVVRAALLLVGVSTYLISPDDVVWRFVKTAPDARRLEHAFFGIAAATLGFALLIKLNASAHPENQYNRTRSRITAAAGSLLQAIGIGSLLPLAGFLVLVLGDVGASLFLNCRHSIAEDSGAERDSRRDRSPLQTSRWGTALAAHIGLCFAFLSMAIFSVVLMDRVADVLFAMTALISIVANSRLFLERKSLFVLWWRRG